jgi:hypothetical protein
VRWPKHIKRRNWQKPDIKEGRPKKLFELRARSVGICSSISAVFDEMLESMFVEFPGESGKFRTISLETETEC